jgi:hypothetical protein
MRARTFVAATFIVTILLALEAQRALIPLTPKLSDLAGAWRLDPTRGAGGICGVGPAPQVSLKVSPTEIEITSSFVHGVVKLDGSETRLFDGRTASATTDAGWLAVTMRRIRPGAAATNVMRDVYIVQGNDLTIWRTLNVEFEDGRDGKIDCGNRHAIVYTRD